MEPTAEQRQFIENAKRMGSVPGLETIRRLLSVLGDPQEKLSIIHVAGTNGKGSVCCYLQHAMTLAGYRVGVYSSPAVFEALECFTVDGTPVAEEAYWNCADRVAEACGRLTAAGFCHPTIFEVETAMAYLLFLEAGCGLVIMETGMGGALDATNAIHKPLCSVVTSIGMDHMGMLGDSLSEIAAQKAGIIKEGCPVISTWQEPEAERVIRQRADALHAPLLFADLSCLAPEGLDRDSSGDGQTVRGKSQQEALVYKGIRLCPKMEGTFQVQNSALAAEVLLFLSRSLERLGRAQIEQGICEAYWPGRMERILERPAVYLDGAHNLPAAIQLKKTIEKKFTNRHITYIIGVLADKDYAGMLTELLPSADRVITVTPDNGRALPGEKLAETVRSIWTGEVQNTDFSGAARLALDGSAEVVIAFGSLSYLKDIRDALSERNEELGHV